jgi:putative ATPase
MEGIGYGAGYVYAPDTDEGIGGLDCLPEALAGTRFWRPGSQGQEVQLAARLEELMSLRRRAKQRTLEERKKRP